MIKSTTIVYYVHLVIIIDMVVLTAWICGLVAAHHAECSMGSEALLPVQF